MTEIAPAPEAGAALAPPLPDPPREEPFRFTGTAGEYFGVWIVNLFLTVVTLGIYSAWAKVRKKRYFYGNTWLAGCNFEYHGNPVAILKGRLLAAAAFAAYTLLTHFSPRAGALLLLAMMPAVPWLLVRSFAFNAANSSYRNLRFRFTGTYREALLAVWPFFVVALLGAVLPEIDAVEAKSWSDLWFTFIPGLLAAAAYPYAIGRIKLLQGNRAHYGDVAFACSAGIGAFYAIYFRAFLIFAGLLLALGAIAGATMFLASSALVVVGPLAYLLGASVVLAFTRARVANLVFNAASIGDVSFASTLRSRRLAAIYAGNMVAITLTLGLAVPWAVIRAARYRAECLSLHAEQGLDLFLGGAAAHVSATGEELGEMFDIDLSL